jgi:hypothetical protein
MTLRGRLTALQGTTDVETTLKTGIAKVLGIDAGKAARIYCHFIALGLRPLQPLSMWINKEVQSRHTRIIN